MARIVVMATALGQDKYDAGDVVDVFPTSALVGKRVALDEWEAAGGSAANFPGLFYVVDVTNLSVSAAEDYLEASTTAGSNGPIVERRREWTVDLSGLNASLTPPSRRTLFTRSHITVTTQETLPFVSRK
jgi:hypothetical protein